MLQLGILVILFSILSGQQLSTDVVFVQTPEDEAVIFGQDLFLACLAINRTTGGSEDLMVRWSLDDRDVITKTSLFSNGTLLVPSVTNDDLGNYTCTVYDSGDEMVLQSPPATIFHAFIKMFEVSPTPVYAQEDEVVSFDCITGESAPAPDIFWERNGEPYKNGDQYSATYGGYDEQSLVIQYSMKLILRARPHLDGSYNCVARNPVLRIDVRSLRVLLQTAELQSAPYVMDEMVDRDIIAALNQAMMLDCPIHGKPQVDIVWFKDDLPLDQIPDFFVLMNGSIHRPNTLLTDEGQYVCEGTNPLGFIRSPNISLTIARIEMEFVEPPEDLFMIAGLTATLKCSPPFSVPIATVTWYKDNALLVPRTGVQSVQIVKTVEGYWNIRFKEIQKIDEGEYFCVATNIYSVPPSRTSSSAVVRVGGAPIFVEPPVGLTIEKGKLAKLTCYVQGDPFPEVTWLFEDIVLTVSDTVSFRQGSQELWIGNVNKGNEGTYTCRGVNRYSSIQTRVYLKVLVPPVVLDPVGHTIASMGDTVIIPCGIYSDPDPTIIWYKDSAAIPLGDRFTQLRDGLYITSVVVEDSGTYLCRASNMAGTVENEGSLEVLVKPHFIQKPKDAVVSIGRNVTLTCIVNGFPKPEITWLFNGSSLFPQDSLLSLNHEELLLRVMSWMHVGQYTCLAVNEEGRTKETVSIKIKIPPKVEKIEGVPLLYQGEHLNLKCHLTGIPFPTVEWFFKRQRIVKSLNGRISTPEPTVLSVKFVSLSDAGVYSCKGINAAGVTQKDINVYILSRPSPPVLYIAETVTATRVRLLWSIEQTLLQTPVDKVIISYRKQVETSSPYTNIELDSTVAEYLVNDLDPASQYIFMVSAVNDAGTSDISNILTAKTYDAGPSAPRNVEVMYVKARNITIGWEIPLITNGQIKKYQINYRETSKLRDISVVITSDNYANHDYLIQDLAPYTRYTLEVRGATMEADQVLWGNWSDTVEVRTSQAAPTGRAREVKAQSLTYDMIQITWEAVTQPRQNGPIKRYYVTYWITSNLTTPIGEETVDSLDLQVNISDLEPWTWYTVKVTPENAGGVGETSEPVIVRTLPTAPASPPLNVTADAYSATSVQVQWLPPPVTDWNSDLTGFIIQFWSGSDTSHSHVFSLGLQDLSTIVVDLDPYTQYDVRVAAFSDQVSDGVGPYSSNVTVQTEQSEPGPVTEPVYTATSTTLKLSWKPPVVTNGIITNYIVLYHLIGSAVVTTPTYQPIMMEHLTKLSNNSHIRENIFHNFQETITSEIIQPVAEVCDRILQNETLFVEFENVTDISQLEEVLQKQVVNVSNNQVFDWMITEHVTLGGLCIELRNELIDILNSEAVVEAVPVFNMTTSATEMTLSFLQPQYIYNISLAAATTAGYGTAVVLEAITLKAAPSPITTNRPVRPVTKRPTTEAPLLQAQPDDTDTLDLPIIIGGGVSGFLLLVIILVVGGCIWIRRRRAHLEEKSKVISEDSMDDTNANNMYGQLDRPNRSPAMANAAEDGTDSVDIYGDEVRFHSPKHQVDQGTEGSFMTEQSGVPPISHGRRIKEAFLGMDNPSYSGLAAPGTVKTNPAYYEEPSSSDLESMSVTMAFSSEDNLQSQAGESTLKRKSKMKSSDAAAIARLRNSVLRPELTETDRALLINNEVEVVYNERTAL